MEKLSGQLKALLLQGANDFHNAVIPAFRDSARSVDQPGTPLAPTQQMVTNDLGEGSYQGFLGKYQAQERSADDRGMER
jgi:hypothetical protein